MFTDSFKYYKSKRSEPNWEDVLDFSKAENHNKEIIKFTIQIPQIASPAPHTPPFGLIPPNEWHCFEVINHPGLVFIRNPFTPIGQRYWIIRCLQDYTKHPNRNNLSTKQFKQDIINDWWSSLQQRTKTDKNLANKMKIAMRWSTLGYHHDWDTKIYSELVKNEFPKDLKELSRYFAEIIGYEKYSAEAAIVNFYPIGTTLAGHTDRSETNLEAPLFSYSFGQTAIFLIGGPTKEEKPTAMYLKSGDIVVMSNLSRLCYHAIPRVMKACESAPWNLISDQEDLTSSEPNVKRLKTCDSLEKLYGIETDLMEKCVEDTYWKPFSEYLNDSRININVRQVLKDGQLSL